MSILALVFMSSVTAAQPTTPIPWFTNDDYPDAAFARRQQGITAFEVAVSPDGRPIGCETLKSSGTPVLDRRACQVAMRAARFAPATDANGRPAWGVYRTQVRWALDPEQWAQMEFGPDVEVNLSKLPGGKTTPVEMKFAYMVDAGGKASNCTAITTTQPKELEALGCQQVLAGAARHAVSHTGNGGAPVVRAAWVRFSPTN